MTTLGPIEGVGRILYRDEYEKISVYPLDEKIGLLMINGRYSRYTGNFAHLPAEYYVRLPERADVALLKKTLNIDLQLGSLVEIGNAVALPYLPPHYDEETQGRVIPQTLSREPGFIEKRIAEIDASPDRNDIINKALENGVDGCEHGCTDVQSVTYVLADGTGVSGLPKELSEKGKNGGPAKTFEANLGALDKRPPVEQLSKFVLSRSIHMAANPYKY